MTMIFFIVTLFKRGIVLPELQKVKPITKIYAQFMYKYITTIESINLIEIPTFHECGALRI